jgi:uncharacterized protein with beta-barrel porin domain
MAIQPKTKKGNLNMKSNVKTERRDGQNLWHQSVVGLLSLLLLTLLAANPLQALGQGVINWSTDYGIDLYSTFGPFIQNVTVTSGSYIDNYYYNNDPYSGTPDAIDGYNHIWHLVNNGTIDSYYYGAGNGAGVYFAEGGSVNNKGNIYGYGNGINISGDPGSVVNSGYIQGYGSDGIYFDRGGSVNNSSSIFGYYTGVDINEGAGTVINSGTIEGDFGDGVYIGANGSVSNSGNIYGYDNGVFIGGPGSVVNNGFIYGGYEEGDSIGSVPSRTTRTLADGDSEGLAGVYLGNGGSVYNNTNGHIYGAYDYGSSDGVYITGGFGYVTNAGIIYGIGDDGVELNNGGVVNNLTGGSIGGDIHGVDINGPATVINAGSINGYGGSGVYLSSGGSVYNDTYDGGTNGIIYGYHNGVEVYGNTGSVVNRGNIYGETGDGVYMDQGGTVVNKRTWSSNGVSVASIQGYGYVSQASIEGYRYGVEITGGAGFVTNSGSITGDTRDGVRLRAGGTVDNQKHGVIGGNNDGVKISGDWGKVINSGVIIGTNNTGVRLEDGGLVVNQTKQRHGNYSGDDSQTTSGYYGNNNPTIEGGRYGVKISGGKGIVINSGTIIGITNAGVLFTDGGIVVNKTSQQHRNNSGDDQETVSGYSGNTIPTIAGGINGVNIFGGTNGVVINSGSISGGTGAGVWLHGGVGGTVVNKTSERHGDYSENDSQPASAYNENIVPTIAGGGWGVVIGGGEGTVINSGTIIGTNDAGVLFTAGGTVVNQTSRRHGNHWGNDYETASAYNGNNIATIEGGNNGVNIFGGTNPVVINSGLIKGVTNDGVLLHKGGSVDNSRHGTIEGGNNGVVIIGGPGSVSNDGDISVVPLITTDSLGSVASSTESIIQAPIIVGNGVYLGGGGNVENDHRGTISGTEYGVEISGGPGVVVNSGYISGDNGTAIKMATALTEGFSNSVTLKTHSEVIGNIDGGGNGTDAAFLQGHGEYGDYLYGFTNFATLTVDASNRRGGWNLTGTNTFSTSATVDSGKLQINGELNSPYVYVNGTLGGSGVINGEVDIESYGTLSPGNSPGILTINGPLNFNGYSTYEVDVRPQTNDLTVVNGTATLQTNAGVYVKLPFWNQWTSDKSIFGSNTVYTILASTNLIGQFNSNVVFNTSMLFLTPSLSYDPTNGYLDLRRKSFTSVAGTANQNGVAGALDGIADSPGTPAMSNLVSEIFWMGSASEVQAALDSLSGALHGTLGMLDVQQQNAFNHSIAQRTGRMSAGGGSGGFASSLKPVQLASAGSTLPPMKQAETNLLDIWLQGFGSFGHLDDDDNALGGDYTISGMSGGLDYRLSPKLLVGLGVGYSQNNADVGGPGANGKVDAFQVGGYGGYVDGPWHLDGIVSCGFLHTDTKRQINVGSIHQEADGSYDGGVLALSAEGGYAFEFDWLTVEPTIGINYAHLWQNSFSESGIANDGNNYGLNVKSVDMDSFRTALGVRLAAQFGKKDGVQFIPALRAVWEHEFADRYADVNARFVGGSGDFTVRGVELGADSGILGAGLTVAFNKAIQGFVNFDANLNSQLNSSTISGGLSYSW